MQPSTKGVVDVVFCLDASGSMSPCIAGVRRNIDAFLNGLGSDANRKFDCRIDYLAHSCNEQGNVFRVESLRLREQQLLSALYDVNGKTDSLFTRDANEMRKGLDSVTTFGDEAVLIALDMCLDFPWRSRGQAHRVVVLLTDEPLEANAESQAQRGMVGAIIEKIHALGVILFLVAPRSPGFEELSEADKSQYQQVGQTGDGLGELDFARVLGHIGKSVSVSVPGMQSTPDYRVHRALFGQDSWQRVNRTIKGGK